MKSDSSSSMAGRGAFRRRDASRMPRNESMTRLDAGHDRHALARRPGDEFVGGVERLVDALDHLAEHAIEPLGLLGGQRRRARGFARQRAQVGDQRLDLLVHLRGELVDAPRQADAGDDRRRPEWPP